MEKIKCYQVAPENTDFSYYFDDDGLKEKYSIVINSGGRNGAKFNEEFLDDFINVWDEYGWNDSMIVALDRVLTGENFENRKKLTIKDVNDLKKLYEDSDGGEYLETAGAFYEIITRKKWEVKSFYGYSKSDYCKILYRPDQYSEESINEVGHVWIGRASEFIIDDCGGYYVIDDIVWAGGETLINKLADISEYSTAELEVYLFDGYTKKARYTRVV